jgi:hypothetical protein
VRKLCSSAGTVLLFTERHADPDRRDTNRVSNTNSIAEADRRL